MKSAGVNPGVAPGSGVDLWLEQREIEALHVALAARVAQGLEIARVRDLVLVRDVFREIFATSGAAGATSRRCQRHFPGIFAGHFPDSPNPAAADARFSIARTFTVDTVFRDSRTITGSSSILSAFGTLEAQRCSTRAVQTRRKYTEAYRDTVESFHGIVSLRFQSARFNCARKLALRRPNSCSNNAVTCDVDSFRRITATTVFEVAV